MKRAVPLILDTLHALALAVWLGGLVTFWFVIIPTVQLGPRLTFNEANAIFGGPQARLGRWIELCGLMMIGVQFLLRRRYQGDRARFIGDGVRQLLTFGALLLAEYARYSRPPPGVFYPGGGINALLIGLAIAQIALLAGVAALTAWLQLPRVTAAPAAVEPSQQPVKAPAPRRTAR
ncbi:MAG TPA: hypothetical protein VFB38_00530 [Chthonomonadaceae bacterium]|nr:hypothetical protein [Chthonomonadaceae bacterium]